MAQAVTPTDGYDARPHILVAEDQGDVIAALHLLLKTNGYEAEFVKSPAEALEALSHRAFDAVLLDLNYSRDTTSGTEGLELLSRVQALDDTLAVLVMTAWGSIDLAVDAMHRGACDFVQKPWDNKQLLKKLEDQMKRARARRQRRLSRDMEQQEAAQIQRALLPQQISSPEGMTIVASSQPARTVGGDYYDVVRLDGGRVGLCIADVVGKGMSAALLMSNLQATVRMLAPDIAVPDVLCERVNKAVSANSVTAKFITFFYCLLDSGKKQISYTNAGHNWPILAHADGSWERLNSEDVVLGTIQDWHYHQVQAGLRSGDRLVLFTDGITEWTSPEGAEFGEERLVRLVLENVGLPAYELKTIILEAVRDYCGCEPSDDATLIVVEID